MKILPALLFFAASVVPFTHGGYLMTTPKKWTSGTKTQICALLTEGGFTPEDSLDLHFDPLSRDPHIPHSIVEFTFTPGESNACVPFDVPSTDGHRARINLSGSLAGAEVDETFNVTIGRIQDSTYIQSDKYRYQPGQNVQFRILSLEGPFLQVIREPYKEVYVENPSRTRIQQWLNVANPGLVHLSFQLAEEPEEGRYNIYVHTSDGRKHSTSFLVEDYVLPRYEVTVEPVGVFLGDDKEITLKLCAKYTFGQDVEGIASMNVSVGSFRTYANIAQEKPISGCQEFTFNTTELRFDDNNCHIRIRNVKAEAKVVETGTGTELHGENNYIPVHRKVINFQNLSPRLIQKRFLPVFNSIQATYNDKKPAANELMNVCTYYNGSNVCKNITTDSSGKLNFITTNTNNNGIEIKSLKYPRLERNFNDVIEESRIYIYHHRSEKFTEAHNSSLSIYTDEEVQCQHGQLVTATIPLIYIVEDKPGDTSADINLQVMSRGQVQYFDKKRVKLQKTALPFDKFPFLLKETNVPKEIIIGKYDFTVILPNTVSPRITVVAWFSKSDGAVIADTKELDVTNCLNNKVNMSWSVNQGEPGSLANLKLTAEAGSICSYGVVDKSVELLSNPSDRLTTNNVLNTVSSYDSRRWDGSQQLNLDYCLRKYNRTLDIPLPEPLDDKRRVDSPVLRPIAPILTMAEPKPPIPVLSQAHVSRKKRSFAHISGIEMEAIDIFRKAGYFVFSNLDLESQYCDRTINRALKDKIAKSQINKKQPESIEIANRIQSRPAQAFSAAPAPPRPQSISLAGGFGGEAALEADVASVPEPAQPPRERTYFPETWLWDLVDIPTTGESNQELTVPDTITEWVGKAVCVHPERGLGLSPKVSLITFTSFFIDLTLPANVKRHEIFPVKISVFNYENHDLPVEVILDRSEDYEFSPRREKGVRFLCIPPNSQRTESIKVKSTKIGEIEIGVNAAVAASNKCGPANPTYKSDRIVRTLPSEAEGFIRERTDSNYLCAEDVQGGVIEPMAIDVPPNIVPDSERAHLNVVGDLLGPSLTNAGTYSVPYGCGEQNMIRLVPYIYLIRYLRASNHDNKEVENRLIQHMRTGYQRQLTFRRGSGSFSTFGDYDKNGSTWLTAFVVKSFSEAKNLITVDQSIIEEAVKWLKQRQGKDGCFEARGTVINKKMTGGVSKKTSLLTAYVLVALIEAEGISDKEVIDGAIRCIKSDASADAANDPYDMALKAYSLTLAGDPQAKTRVADLVGAAVVDDKHMRWDIPHSRNEALEIETTGYGLLAMLASDPRQHLLDARKIVRYLSSKRNSRGNFRSTQDTVVALQALAAFETLKPSGPLNLNVTAQTGSLSREFLVSDANKFLQQTEQIPSLPSSVNLGISGSGCALVQTVLRYNILIEDQSEAFNLRLDVTPAKGDCASRTMNICTSYRLPDIRSNMAVIEANLLTGYVPDISDLQQAVASSDSVKRYEYDYGKVTFYLDEVTAEEICVSFKVNRDIDIDNHQERHIKVYDYYQPEYSYEHKYKFDLTSCNVS